MNDKELLMMAAKSVNLLQDYFGGEFTDRGVFLMPLAEMPDLSDPKSADVLSQPVSRVLWNPLTEDADALRLAVKLEMDIGQYAGSVEVGAYYEGDFINTVSAEIADCRLSATRRAIVRAAAEIGSKL